MRSNDGAYDVCPERVCVITVTYGDRYNYVERVVNAALEEGSGRVVVVDNDSTVASRQRMNALATSVGERVRVVQMTSNAGSAGGFKAGLEMAAKYADSDFVWLLDDDNVPKPESLERLCTAYRLLGSEPRNVLLSLRKSLWWYVKTAADGAPVGIVSNSFMGFHLLDLPAKLMRRIRKPGDQLGVPRFPLAAVDVAPYGGLFFHKSWLERIGLPDERLVVYQDDIEFSHRFVQAGGQIFLCALSEVEDIERSWFLRPSSGHPLLAPNADPRRVYFACRNRVWVERQHITSRVMYMTNRWVYVCLLMLVGVLMIRRPSALARRLGLLKQAWRDADAGRLGTGEWLGHE